jgi:hypothetical protein
MPLFASFEQKFKIKKMPKLGCPNCFIVNKLKENVALPIKGCLVAKAFGCLHEVLGSNSSNSCT